MTYREEYARWLNAPLTPDEHAELASIHDDREIRERFYAPLTFGTAGLRGILGMGINRMNTYTVCQVTQGLATLIVGLGKEAMARGVAVCYDCRHKSPEFARAVAEVLTGNGIRVLLFDAMRPTPELSFAIRYYQCIAGVNITASHNPKEYNGYKVYWEDGAQLPPAEADIVSCAIAKVDLFTGVTRMAFDDAVAQGLIVFLGHETDEAFLSCCLSQSVARDAVEKAADTLKIVYTPFHGTGYKLVPEILSRIGLKHLLCDPVQSIPDADFPTVKSPNPQDAEGFAGSIKLARENDADLILGTDPDADRIGIVVRDRKGEYKTVTGNQTGCLLLDFLIRAKKERGTLPENAAVVKTIVTTEMARTIAEKNGVYCADTFTGFKFLAEQIRKFEETGSHRFILAFEESYGYLVGDGARDKDAVTAAMLITEMAAWYHLRGMTLCDALEDLYARYGYYIDETVNLVFPGADGLQTMKNLMDNLRAETPRTLAGTEVLRLRDYLTGTAKTLSGGTEEAIEPQGSNVLGFDMADGTRIIVRPSGTEPKIRVYILLHGTDRDECAQRVKRYAEVARGFGK
ncbi:MAG: phospho-sugar mutase [Eubacteriales bacterium]|jgi:phosphoglucomutase